MLKWLWFKWHEPTKAHSGCDKQVPRSMSSCFGLVSWCVFLLTFSIHISCLVASQKRIFLIMESQGLQGQTALYIEDKLKDRSFFHFKYLKWVSWLCNLNIVHISLHTLGRTQEGIVECSIDWGCVWCGIMWAIQGPIRSLFSLSSALYVESVLRHNL